MSEQNVTPRGFSVGDLASPETVQAIALMAAMSAVEAGANFRKAVRELQHDAGTTAEELQPLGDGIRAVAAQIAEEADRG